jgi:hypothetical protein
MISWKICSLFRALRKRWGYDKYSAETIDRLLHSEHAEDLRWIVDISTVGAALLALLGIAVLLWLSHGTTDKLPASLLPFQLSAVFAGLCATVAWCYQTGSSRLGIVDLIACEISTLCRICAINGLADNCIRAFKLDSADGAQFAPDEIKQLREQFSHFDSAEAYTPVFDSNAKELRDLRVKVVTNITGFYTYWKATRDAFRKLAKTPNEQWKSAMLNVIYMQFMAYESARKAVRDLIEFEPNRAENTIVMLLGELPAYDSLLKYFLPGDIRYERLEIRKHHYETNVPKLYYRTGDEHDKYDDLDKLKAKFPNRRREDLEELRKDWKKAYKLRDELKKRYITAIGEFPPKEEPTRSNNDTLSPLARAGVLLAGLAKAATAALCLATRRFLKPQTIETGAEPSAVSPPRP